MSQNLGALLSVLLVAACSNASIFDFESEAITSIGGTPVGAHTSLSIVDDGLEMTIYRMNGVGVDIVDLNPFGPSSWGRRSFDPFFDPSHPISNIVINFDSLVTNFSMDFGDFGFDTDDLVVSGYSGLDGTGSLVDFNTYTLPSTIDFIWTGGTALLSGEISSVVLEMKSSVFPHPIFLDNIRATAVPTPTALSFLGLAMLGAARRVRR